MAELAPATDAPTGQDEQPQAGANTELTRVLDALSTRSPRAAHDIAARCGLSVSTVQAILGVAALDGSVVERERGWVKKGG